MERKNNEIEQARAALEDRAHQLALASKYKSEFLANMSHEVRTPLNSLLILAKLLADNADGHLSPKEIEFARNIHDSGSDLLALINDILDLSKIEAGAMQLDLEEVSLASVCDYVERSFREVAVARGLGFEVALDARSPASIVTDARRLQQALRNLLSNAFKFTERGEVKLFVGPAARGWSPESASLAEAQTVVAFSVSDTGIGIPLDKQKPTTALTPNRAIADMLLSHRAEESDSAVGPGVWANDDRRSICPGDRVVLIVEDDPQFARKLLDLAHAKAFKGVVAQRGNAALTLARDLQPDAIVLDLGLSDMDGWSVLDRLKHDPPCRHVPIHVLRGRPAAARAGRHLAEPRAGRRARPRPARDRSVRTLRRRVRGDRRREQAVQAPCVSLAAPRVRPSPALAPAPPRGGSRRRAR